MMGDILILILTKTFKLDNSLVQNFRYWRMCKPLTYIYIIYYSLSLFFACFRNTGTFLYLMNCLFSRILKICFIYTCDNFICLEFTREIIFSKIQSDIILELLQPYLYKHGSSYMVHIESSSWSPARYNITVRN